MVSRPMSLDSPQRLLPPGVEEQGSETSGHVSFLSDMPLDILHARLLDAFNASTFSLRQQSFLQNKVSLASPPDCLTAASGKYPSSWVSIGNEAWQAAGCGYYREIETQTSSVETQRILSLAGKGKRRGAVGYKEQRSDLRHRIQETYLVISNHSHHQIFKNTDLWISKKRENYHK